MVPDGEIRKAAAVYFRALAHGPKRTEDVTALLVADGVRFSASEQARKRLHIIERICRGESWLILPSRSRQPQNSVVTSPETQ
jgi:hypothetical protein